MKAFSPDFLAGSSVSPDLNSATYVLILIRTVLECELADRSQSPDCGERLPVKTCGSPITIWIRGWQTASGGSFALLGPLGPGGVLTSCSRSTSPRRASYITRAIAATMSTITRTVTTTYLFPLGAVQLGWGRADSSGTPALQVVEYHQRVRHDESVPAGGGNDRDVQLAQRRLQLDVRD